MAGAAGSNFAAGVCGNFDDPVSIPRLPFLFSSCGDVGARLMNSEGGKHMSDLLERPVFRQAPGNRQNQRSFHHNHAYVKQDIARSNEYAEAYKILGHV
ncbi:hypothetical protein AALA80_11280 [Oscillospiraceae bacterium 50-60]|nr:hypothetical protein [Oscillibacter sp.]